MKPLPGRRRSDQEESVVPAMTALVVDDEAGYRAVLIRLLLRLGFVVDEAEDAQGAAGFLTRAQYDLLITNVDTPGVSELDSILRSNAIFKIVLTCQEDMEKRLTALAAGYDEFLSKSSTELEIVAKLVGARRTITRQQTFDLVLRELYGLTTRDELTGVFNRRFFVTEAEKLLRQDEAITVAIFDLDEFKQVNDSCGHLAGDRILRDVGALFQRCTRPEDLLARYGGDEFVMLVRGMTVTEVESIAHRLSIEISRLQWTFGGAPFRISATTGVATSALLRDPTLSQVLDVADRDLYKNKWMKKHAAGNMASDHDQPPAVSVTPPPGPAAPEKQERAR